MGQGQKSDITVTTCEMTLCFTSKSLFFLIRRRDRNADLLLLLSAADGVDVQVTGRPVLSCWAAGFLPLQQAVGAQAGGQLRRPRGVQA